MFAIYTRCSRKLLPTNDSGLLSSQIEKRPHPHTYVLRLESLQEKHSVCILLLGLHFQYGRVDKYRLAILLSQCKILQIYSGTYNDSSESYELCEKCFMLGKNDSKKCISSRIFSISMNLYIQFGISQKIHFVHSHFNFAPLLLES